jgi:DNA-binding response OmpR family regulator
MDVKSVITNPSPQAPITHGPGPMVLTGVAWSGRGTIPRVDITLDGGKDWHEARIDGSSVHLTPKEFTLLEIMVKQPGRVFSRFELLELAFGYDYQGFERTVDVHMMNLRKKIESDPANPRYVQTVYGVGYKFDDGAYV